MDARKSRPVLILWGREDACIPVTRGEALRDMIPGAVLRKIPRAGHLVIEEKPDQLLEEIRAYFSKPEKLYEMGRTVSEANPLFYRSNGR